MGNTQSSPHGKTHPQQPKPNPLRPLSTQPTRPQSSSHRRLSAPPDTPTSPLSILPGASRSLPHTAAQPIAQTIPARHIQLAQESPFVGSPLVASEHFSQANPPALSRSIQRRMRSSSRLSEVSEFNSSGVVDMQVDDMSDRPFPASDTELSLEGLDLQPGNGGKGGMLSEALEIPSRRPVAHEQLHTYVQPANERSYRNSAKIVHGFGPGGIAPLAQLGSRAEDKTRKVIPVMVNWTQGGRTVYITGTFNNWKQKIRLSQSNADFTTVIDMPPGTHRFKFIVDDEWKCSDELPMASDSDGNLVNYLEVMDEWGERQGDGLDGLSRYGDGIDSATPPPLSESPPTSYSTEIPSYLLNPSSSSPLTRSHLPRGNAQSSPTSDPPLSPISPQSPSSIPTEPPPHLPPHLEKVLLNSNQVSKEDASVLPVPNHVTLNHLYACSIRDGVMALACTSRYRKKYVTTVLYKPVFN